MYVKSLNWWMQAEGVSEAKLDKEGSDGWRASKDSQEGK